MYGEKLDEDLKMIFKISVKKNLFLIIGLNDSIFQSRSAADVFVNEGKAGEENLLPGSQQQGHWLITQ